MQEEKLNEELQKIEPEARYRIGEVAEKVACHRNTILKYEREGFIEPVRDRNGCRWFTPQEIIKIKAILKLRQ
jgi:DNA-binding transcriptional MerR regulator